MRIVIEMVVNTLQKTFLLTMIALFIIEHWVSKSVLRQTNLGFCPSQEEAESAWDVWNASNVFMATWAVFVMLKWGIYLYGKAQPEKPEAPVEPL